jgi:4-amino-4-deoxy-L-arabinose transferase-like glycosyltransferase
MLQSFFYPNFILAEEHHYLEVASGVFYQDNWWMLRDTMGKYFNKPPLLFWLIAGLWKIFGPYNWVIHFFMMSVLAAILYLTRHLSRLLFGDAEHARLAPIIVLGCFFFLSRGTVFSFDTLTVLFFLLSAMGVVLALHQRYWMGFTVFGFSLGLGILTKGLIILVFSFPFFLVATLLRHHYEVKNFSWFLGFALSVFMTLMLMMVWLLPMLSYWNVAQIKSFILSRGLGVGDIYGHAPFYAYIKIFPLLILPWICWPYGIRSLLRAIKNKDKTPALKLVIYSLLLSMVVLSFIPPKTMRYILPSVILFALIYAYALSQYVLEFCKRRDSSRSVIAVITCITVMVILVTLFCRSWVVSKISYPALTYSWLLLFESLMAFFGFFLISLKNRNVIFESMRLCFFTFIMVMSTVVLPHEVLSMRFPYHDFVMHMNELEQQNIPIVYCRSYGGYQFSMTSSALLSKKYTISAEESERYPWVYFVARVRDSRQAYLFHLVEPSQTAIITVTKVPSKSVATLRFTQQLC